jgi:hypothetical protein
MVWILNRYVRAADRRTARFAASVRHQPLRGSIFGLSIGLIFGLIFALSSGLIFGLIFGLILGLIFVLVSGLIGGFTDRIKVDKASPNQGIKLSRKNSLVVFVTWLTVGLIRGLIFGLIGGVIFGLIAGLNRGGSAVIKHYALRLTLWRNGYMPLNFVAFLDHCAMLILLKKVGGGYIFIHRMLHEYFAELDTPRNSAIER